jgi:hypothetical protein
MLPAKVEMPRKWIAGPSGEVIKWEPPPQVRKKDLTAVQQHTAMRLALAHALRLLTEHGFHTNCIEQSTVAISVGYKGGLNFDVAIRVPARIAYVTSVPNDDRKRQKIGEDVMGNAIYNTGSGVRLASDVIRGEYVVQIICSKISSLMPLYVECPPDEQDPVGYVLRNVLTVIANVVKDQKLMEQVELDTASMTKGELPDFLLAP